MRVGNYAAVLAAAVVIAVATIAAARAEVIEPDSVAGKNIQIAAHFIRENGNPKLANNILEFLAKGYLSRERLSGKVGATSAFNNIDLDPSVVTPAADNLIANSPHYIVQLAAVLTHEKRHAHQHVWDKIGESFKEFDAWSTEIIEEDNWIGSVYKKYDGSTDPADLAMLKELLDTKAETLREFIEDQNCFGYGCDVWKKLREAIVDLRKLLPETPRKTEDKRVGMLIDQSKKTEQVALLPTTPPAGGCWMEAMSRDVVPPAQYTPNGARFGDPFDPRVALGGDGQFSRLVDGNWVNLDSGQPVPPRDLIPAGAAADSPDRATMGPFRFDRVACPAGVMTPPPSGTLPGIGVGIGIGGHRDRRDRSDERDDRDRPATSKSPTMEDR